MTARGESSEWSKRLRVDSRGRKQYEGKPTSFQFAFVEVFAKEMFDPLASTIPRKEFEEAGGYLAFRQLYLSLTIPSHHSPLSRRLDLLNERRV